MVTNYETFVDNTNLAPAGFFIARRKVWLKVKSKEPAFLSDKSEIGRNALKILDQQLKIESRSCG
ncbi:hypothetical protein CQA86_32060 [Klebsiella pneumoniae]|nr:hypothetical protein CQA86_32060 [Klebsiella pneumoniae]